MNPEKQINDQLLGLEFELQGTRSKLHDLATMGALITSIRDQETILSIVMEMSIRMVDAEVGLIQLEEDGALTAKITWGIDDFIIKNIIYKEDKDIAAYCFEKGETLVLNKGEHSFDFGPNINNVLAVPIKSKSENHGAIVVFNKTDEGGFTDGDRENLEMLVNFATVAIENQILLAESLQKQKLEQELDIARQVQQTILPDSEATIENVEMGVMYRPARVVGGDFYDTIKCDDKNFYMVIGDVSNKGIPAAMVMSATTAIIRSEIMRDQQIKPSDLMINLNNVLCNGVIKSNDMFVTLFIARINLDKKQVIYCNAGHNPPLFYSSEEGEITELRSGGTFVGQFADIPYKEGEFKVEGGDRLLAYTDGVTETEDYHGGQFGTERLMQAFLNFIDLPAHEFCAKVKEWVDRFAEGTGDEPFDDFTLFEVIFRWEST